MKWDEVWFGFVSIWYWTSSRNAHNLQFFKSNKSTILSNIEIVGFAIKYALRVDNNLPPNIRKLMTLVTFWAPTISWISNFHFEVSLGITALVTSSITTSHGSGFWSTEHAGQCRTRNNLLYKVTTDYIYIFQKCFKSVCCRYPQTNVTRDPCS